MPFTFSHPAIVVPLARLWPRVLPLTPLVVGTLAPDFEYFVWLKPRRTIGHDLIGIPIMCVPAGLAALFIFERLMKGPLIDLCPNAVRHRLWASRAPMPLWGWPRVAAVVLALVVGALTHVAWDAVTHGNPWASLLKLTQSHAGGAASRSTNVLQPISSVLGLGLVVAWSGLWLCRQPKADDVPPQLPVRFRLLIVAAIVGIAACCGAVMFVLRPAEGLAARLVPAIVTAITAVSC